MLFLTFLLIETCKLTLKHFLEDFNIFIGTKDMKSASLQRNITTGPGKSTIPKKKEEVF